MDYQRAREVMVLRQLEGRGINDPRLLNAMGRVPRERFVDTEYRDMAYRDQALPIGQGQTISQPYVVAVMTLALAIHPGDKVLEVGTGSGYHAAVMSEMGARVFTMERYDDLAQKARGILDELGYEDVAVRCGDGSLGWPEEAPFDGIVVAASGPTIPTPFLEQLRVNRHLIMPVAQDRMNQVLVRITKQKGGRYERKDLANVSFVPLIGEEGWQNENRGTWF